MLTAKRISKKFETRHTSDHILDNINLKLNKGEIVAIVGQSGIGKSTLLKIFSELCQPDTGTINYTGKIGYIPQNDFLLPWRNVWENILLPAEISGQIDQNTITQAKELLLEHNLHHHSYLYPQQISGGMKQKTSLIRTLIQNPDILLLDEPFSAIDAFSRTQIITKLRKSIVSAEKSSILITHNLEEAIIFSDRILLLGNKPAKIISEQIVRIPNHARNPLQIRKTQEFENLYAKIWPNICKSYENKP